MKIAFDVDVLAKQMSINDYVHKVADWGYKYIEQSPHPRINPFYKHPLFSKECQQEYKQALKETGVEISSFIVVYRWSGPTEEQRQHAVANWKRMIEIAVDMGVPVINTEFSGDPNQQEICNGMFFKSMEELLPIIEREGIRREGDTKRIEELSHEIDELNSQRSEMRAKWQSEKGMLDKIQKNKELIEEYKQQAVEAERNGDYGLVAEIRYGKIREAEEQIALLQEELNKASSSHGSMIKEEVDAEDIAEVVAKWTGIPVSRMLESEREKLLNLEKELHRRVVGQDEAISAVADAVRRSRAGLQDARRPIGSFIFLGTTGVGKTELAKALAEFLFDDENMMTRIDMSEYQERHAVSRLIGAPPGYVGYDEGGQLTEAVRRKPYSVVLLDEIEKAHPDVFNILLQVLDDGRLTDNKGRTVDFRNTIIIMTSNMGSHLIMDNFSRGYDGEKIPQEVIDRTRGDVIDMLKQTLKPEFLNRIDEIVMFTPLTKENVYEIVGIQIRSLTKMLAENGIELQVTPKAQEWLARQGYDPMYGARPVKRTIQRYIVNDLSKKILAGDVEKERPIVIDAANDTLTYRN